MNIKVLACSITLCLMLVFISGCQKQNEQIYQLYTGDPENMLKNLDNTGTETSMIIGQDTIDETQGELTIYAPYYPPSDYDWIIKAFNKKYPNIQVTVTGSTGAYGNHTPITEIVKKVSVDLMSGSAGDIIDLRTQPYIQYGKNNVLEDLYSYMENDPEFHMEDYYTNILKATEYKGKLYAMPSSFYYFCVRFNKSLLEKNQIEAPEGDSIDYKKILDIYHKIYPSNDKLILTHYWTHYILEFVEGIGYFDYKQDKADYNSMGYIDFLNETKRIQYPSQEEVRLTMQKGFRMEEFSETVDENDLCLFVFSCYQDARNAVIFYDAPNLTLPIPMSTTNGDKGFVDQGETFGITSSSKNKDLAWKFIRFCIEEKPVEFLTNRDVCFIGGMPINRNNALKMLEAAFGEGKEEAVQLVDRWNSERNKINDPLTGGVLIEAIGNFLDEFYAGRITAEECARQIQERVEIYLKE